jgi:hypothetical protein
LAVEAYVIGRFIGALVGVYIFSQIAEWLIFKRVFNDPIKGKVTSVAAIYLLGALSFDYRAGQSGREELSGFIYYLPAALIVGFFAVRRGLKLREQAGQNNSLTEAFD